jgi:hypothetical protein
VIPDPAREVCAAWLDDIDQRAPGLVVGLHLRGGLGFGEFVPGTSDVDFVAVLSRRPSGSEVEALEDSHVAVAAAYPATPFDGIHLTAGDLAGDPEDCPDLPCVLHGWFEPAGRYDVSPVAWHELAHHSIRVRGELPPVWTDHQRLLEFTRDNLTTYWADQAAALAKFPDEAARDDSCAWCVLGVARLHHLLVTGEMTAKGAAGRWGLGYYDARWLPLLREALRLRSGDDGPGEYDDPAARGRDTAAFTAYVVETAG